MTDVRGILLAALWSATATSAAAQTCRLPEAIRPAPELPAPRSEVSRTATGHHVLALTWSPEWCRTRSDKIQCRDNSFGFVLHGLWPSADEGPHPRYCGAAPPLDAATVQRHLCMTPSVELLQHEWAAHGTCGWKTAQAYFAQAAALWAAVNMPKLSAAAMTAGELRGLFVAANPQFPRDAVNVRVASGNRLLEVGLCYDLKFRPAACPRGVGAPDGVTIRVTPGPDT